jgi:hypothetical protein
MRSLPIPAAVSLETAAVAVAVANRVRTTLAMA